ncbi:hypothetical protein HU200_021702 [Digitaria exilis]|uniref:Uncharacterized protein n=1 Tax=Digitaria exilis TaxID=1010633 RepID=A0A835EZH7_9POAL|nr:hypothetical protein HU200_021702 [Digitaria exilis]
MALDRAADFVNLESGEESDDADTESQDFYDSQAFSQSEGDPYAAYSYGYDESNESIKRAAYVQVLKDLAEIKILKSKLAMSLPHQVVVSIILQLSIWTLLILVVAKFPMIFHGSLCGKDMIFLQNRSSVLLDDDFCEKLDSYSGCKLPVVSKEKICNLIQTFCFNPRMPVNLEVNSINGLPDEMKKSFCNLLNYVSNINSRTPKLILDLVKLFADSADTDDPNIVRSPQVTPSHEHIRTPVNNNFDFSEPKDFDNIEENGSHGVFCSQYELHKSFHSSSHLNIDPQVMNDNVVRVMQKLSRNNLSSQFPSSSTPSRFKTQSPGLKSNLHKRSLDSQGTSQHQHFHEYNRPALQDSTNLRSAKRITKSGDNLFVPDSISPSSNPRLSRFHSQKAALGKENDSPSLSQNGNCEVQIVGEKTLSDKVRELSNKSNALYNSNLRNSGASAATPVVVSPHGPSASRPCTQSVSFRARDNSTGGKMPRYGPHRLLNPGHLFQGDFCTASNKIGVSKSQIDNCKAICKLSSSQFKGTDVYQQILSEKMRSAFEFYWQKYIHFDMGFDEYDFIFPVVPQQPLDNTYDSGIYAMMFLEHWNSPRTKLTSIFTPQDIPKIRILIANQLVFHHKNTGMKNRVVDFKLEDLQWKQFLDFHLNLIPPNYSIIIVEISFFIVIICLLSDLQISLDIILHAIYVRGYLYKQNDLPVSLVFCTQFSVYLKPISAYFEDEANLCNLRSIFCWCCALAAHIDCLL